jgi:3-hydroxyisobutyrate dehydrogenase
MVESLLRAGVATVVFDLDRSVVDELAAIGATPAGSIAELAEAVDVVGVCVPADAHVRAVLSGADGLLAHLPEGAVVAIHSTVLPDTISWAVEEAVPHSIGVVEAAVTGGAMAAADGRLTFLLCGTEGDVGALAPLLEACGDKRVVLERMGDASRVKLCLNLTTYSTFMGVAEAATLAKSMGLGLDRLKDALRANGQLPELVDTYLIGHELSADDLSAPDMVQSLERYSAIIRKDLDLVSRLAEEQGVPSDVAELAGRLAERVYFTEQVS